MAAIRVLLVEDDTFTRTTMATALGSLGLEIIYQTASVSDAVSNTKATMPDAAVLDLDLGAGPNGIDLAHGLRRVCPDIGIVLLTGFVDPRLLDVEVAKLPRGSQYLIKQSIKNVETVRDAIMKSISSAHEGPVVTPSLDISDTLLEVLRMLAQGLPNDAIAKARGVTEKSVEQNISRLVEHFGLTNTAQNKRVQLARIYFKATGSHQSMESAIK